MNRDQAIRKAAIIGARQAVELTRINVGLLTAAQSARKSLPGDGRATEFYGLCADVTENPARAIAQIAALAIFALNVAETLSDSRGEPVEALLERYGLGTAML